MNTATKHCRACKTADMREITYGENLTVKGVDLHVEGLVAWECPNCHAQVETAEQMDRNAETVRTAYTLKRASFKQEYGLLTGEEICAFRTQFELTQKEAARLFGGGPTAFSKYEAETIVHNTSMDRLLRLAMKEPSYLRDIAEIAHVDLSKKTLHAIDDYFERKQSDLLTKISHQWGIEKRNTFKNSAREIRSHSHGNRTNLELATYLFFQGKVNDPEEFYAVELEKRIAA